MGQGQDAGEGIDEVFSVMEMVWHLSFIPLIMTVGLIDKKLGGQ